MARELVRNAQKNQHIPAKELKKRVANTVPTIHRTIYFKQWPTWSFQEEGLSYDLNTKWSIWSMQKKTLRSLKPFGTMWFGLTQSKLYFLATTKERMFGEKRVEYIPSNINKLSTLMLKGQSRHWSWRQVEYCSKTTIQSIPQNQPLSASRKDWWRSWNGHQAPDLNIIKSMRRDLKHAIHAWKQFSFLTFLRDMQCATWESNLQPWWCLGLHFCIVYLSIIITKHTELIVSGFFLSVTENWPCVSLHVFLYRVQVEEL